MAISNAPSTARMLRNEKNDGTEAAAGMVPTVQADGSVDFAASSSQLFQDPFELLYPSLTNEHRERAILLQELQQDFADLLIANNTIDGANLAAFDQYLRAVWRMNDLGGPVDDSLNSFGLAVTGTPLFLESGANALNGNAIKQTHETNDYFERAPGLFGDLTEDWSLSIWLKPDVIVTDSGIFSITQKNSANYVTFQFLNDTTLQLNSRIASVSQTVLQATVPSVLGAYHNLVVTMENLGSNQGKYTWYWDKLQVAAGNRSIADLSLLDFFLGIEYDNAIRSGFVGWFDECRLWKGIGAVLSPRAVVELVGPPALFP